MKPLGQLIITLCFLCAPILTLGQQSDLNVRVQRLERLVEKQNYSLRNMEERIRRLEYLDNPAPYPTPIEPGDQCTVIYNGEACKFSSYKYSIEANGKAITECIATMDTVVEKFKNLKSAGVCRSAAPESQCKMIYNGEACKFSSYKYSIEANGKALSECISTQDGALEILKKLRTASVCY